MYKSEIPSIEDREKSPLTVSDIQSRISLLRESEGRLFGKGADALKIVADMCKMRERFVEELLKEKERFNKVFKTSSGSVYFQLMTGETVRAKRMLNKDEFDAGEGQHFKMQPILKELFFITPEEEERTHDSRGYPGETIHTSDYQIGVHPVELNIHKYGSQIVTERTENGILLKGTIFGDGEEIDAEGNLVGGLHVGHPITEIIK